MAEKHDTLNAKIWDLKNNKLKPEVYEKIKQIVGEFCENLEENNIDIKIVDIVLVGSNCSYNYSDNSDLDIHIRTDVSMYENEKQRDLIVQVYNLYRKLWDKKYDIKFYDIPVELYIETKFNELSEDFFPINEKGIIKQERPLVSNGVYSVLKNEWVKRPVAEEIPEVDNKKLKKLVDAIESKYENIIKDIDKKLYEAFTPREYNIALSKMKDFNAGTRRENLKACGDQKLMDYYDICVANNLHTAASKIKTELVSRGLIQPNSNIGATVYQLGNTSIGISVIASDLTDDIAKTIIAKANLPVIISTNLLQVNNSKDTIIKNFILYLLVAVALKKSAVMSELRDTLQLLFNTEKLSGDDIKNCLLEILKDKNVKDRLDEISSNYANQNNQQQLENLSEDMQDKTDVSNSKAIIADQIRGEWEAIQNYNKAIHDLEKTNGNFSSVIDILNDIADEEEIHVGELQKAHSLLDNNVLDNIAEGEIEAEENLAENYILTEEIHTKKIDEIDEFIENIFALRAAGLEKGGEYSIENLAFKEIRNKGYIDNLKKLKTSLVSKELSLQENYGSATCYDSLLKY